MPTRALTDDELQRVADLLDGLVRRLDPITQALLAPEADHVMVAELRANVATAGKYLLRLLHHDALDAPEAVPPWLSLSLRRLGRRPRFDGVLDPSSGMCRTTFEPMKLGALIALIIEDFEPNDPARVRRPREVDPAPFRRRHVFLEASMGWLGQKLGVQAEVETRGVGVIPERKHGQPDAPLHLCIDLYRGNPNNERLLFLDIAKLCTNACAALSKEMDRLATTLRQSRIAADLIKVPIPLTHNFHQLAVALLGESRSVIRFLTTPHAHEDWAALSAHIPPHLREPVDAYWAAQGIVSLAQHELQEAMRGTLCGAWIEDFHRNRPAALQALKAALTHAEGRAKRAAQREQETAHERRKVEDVLEEVWLQKHREVLRVLHDHYVEVVRRLAVHVDGVGSGFALGKWKGTSACDVLMQVTSDLVTLLSSDDRRGEYGQASSLSRELTNVKHDAWQELELAVRRESAEIVQNVTEGRWGDAGELQPTPQSSSGEGDPPRLSIEREERWASAVAEEQQPREPVLSKSQSPEASAHKVMTAAQEKKHKRREAIREILRLNNGTVPPHKDIVKALEERGITCKTNTVTHDLRAMMRPEQQ